MGLDHHATILPLPPPSRDSEAPPSGFVTKDARTTTIAEPFLGDDYGDGDDGRLTVEIDLDAPTLDVSVEAAVLAASEAARDALDRATDLDLDPTEASEPTRFMQKPDMRLVR